MTSENTGSGFVFMICDNIGPLLIGPAGEIPNLERFELQSPYYVAHKKRAVVRESRLPFYLYEKSDGN